MPRRLPIDPTGIYHVGSRGVYGRTLWSDVGQHERFLFLFRRAATKYRIQTLEWALVENHHHFVVRLHDGRLSELMREVHSQYARWLHTLEGQTRRGHAFRHAFFARQLTANDDVLSACVYVTNNLLRHREVAEPALGDWGGYRALLGLEHPRGFHSPHALLELVHPDPRRAREIYRELVTERHARARLGSSPNDVVERG